MNVTRRNNGLAITGTDNEIIALLASLEYGLYAQAGVESTFRDERGKAAKVEYLARHREAKRLRMVAENLQAGGEPLPSEWHKVTIMVDRPNFPNPAQLIYIMSDEELNSLRTDFANYVHSNDTTKHGTYAFVEGISFTPGTVALAFEGMEIMEIQPMPDFTPPGSYSASQSAVNIIRTRIKY